MGKVIAQTKYEALEAGTYRAKIGAVATEEGQFGEQVKIRFDLLEDELADKSIMAWASAKLSPKSKLYGWVSMLLFSGEPLPEDFNLDLDWLLDRDCILIVEVTHKDTGDYNVVKSLVPVRGVKAPAVITGGNGGQAPTGAAGDERTITQSRPPLTAASAAGLTAGPVRVSIGTPDPGDVPAWMDESGLPAELPF